MPVFRALLLLMLLACAACFAVYAATAQMRYRWWGVRIMQWTIGAAVVFFGVLVVERWSELW